MRWTDVGEERCSIARALAVLGDRWTLLVLRECFNGVRRFDAFQARLGVTRHVLTERLRRLERHGVLTRVPYQDRPLRHEYRLTAKGRDLFPIMVTLMTWGDRHEAAPDGPPVRLVDRETGQPVTPLLVDERTGRPVGTRTVRGQPI